MSATTFEQGQTLGRGDLFILLENALGNPTSAYSISYAIYFVDPLTSQEVLIGPAAKDPVNPVVGEYYAAMLIPSNATPGCYRIRWVFRQTSASAEEGVVQEFGITSDEPVVGTQVYSACIRDLIAKMRVLTRDNNPDRNYRFMPPQGEGEIGCFNQVFGFIWEDDEFAQYLEIALWKFNMLPPNTDGRYRSIEVICTQRPSYGAALLWGALVNAAQAMAYNWVANEFNYSIGGVSLDIQKSSGYMDLKRNAEEQWDKLTEAKQRTEKYVRGLQQPRFGRGIRSAFGPNVGRGVLSPRNFV